VDLVFNNNGLTQSKCLAEEGKLDKEDVELRNGSENQNWT